MLRLVHGQLVRGSVSISMLCSYLYPGVQDEREIKRQRRKQSNRESARRSRLRKQVKLVPSVICYVSPC